MIRVSVRVRMYVYVCVIVCMLVCVWLCVCVCVCLCVHIESKRYLFCCADAAGNLIVVCVLADGLASLVFVAT